MSNQTVDCSSKNPYSWWRQPLLARRWKYVQALHREFDVQRAYANDYELTNLVPDLRDRASSLKEVFGKMKDVCQDQQVALLISKILQPMIPTLAGSATTPLGVARDYLDEVAAQIDREFIEEIDDATRVVVLDHGTLIDFLQRMFRLAESILVAKDGLFSYRFLAQLYFKNPATDEAVVWPPADHDMILSYFRVYLEQLVRTAEGMRGTIDNWRKSVVEARKPFLEFLAAHTNARTGRLTIVIQMLAIVLALSLSTFFLTARDPFSLWRENARLRGELRELRSTPSSAGTRIDRGYEGRTDAGR